MVSKTTQGKLEQFQLSAVLHYNKGNQYRKQLYRDIVDYVSSNRFVANMQEIDSDIFVTEQDLPMKLAEKVQSISKERKKPHCRICNVPTKGHKCPYKNQNILETNKKQMSDVNENSIEK